mgnify:CR=1 FL=1
MMFREDNRMFLKTGCLSILLLVAAAAPGIAPGEGRAELFGGVQYSLDTYAGYHAASVGGYRGKVGEFESLDSGMEGGFTLHSYGRGNYLDAAGMLRDEDDQRYLLDFDAGRIFESETTYTRFKHYLDHDSLTNQDSFTDHDPFNRNAIIREEMKSENTLRVPFILAGPGVPPGGVARTVARVLHLEAGAVSTSGDYRDYFEFARVRYSHTIDPRSGSPVRHGLASVTVIRPTAAEADALATALSVLGPSEGYELAERMGWAAYFVEHTPDGMQPRETGAFAPAAQAAESRP